MRLATAARAALAALEARAARDTLIPIPPVTAAPPATAGRTPISHSPLTARLIPRRERMEYVIYIALAVLAFLALTGDYAKIEH